MFSAGNKVLGTGIVTVTSDKASNYMRICGGWGGGGVGGGNTTVIVLKFIIRYIADDEESFPFFSLSHLLISSSWFSFPGKL